MKKSAQNKFSHNVKKKKKQKLLLSIINYLKKLDLDFNIFF